MSWSGQTPLPAKGILGTAYEFATGQRLGSGDFEDGKNGAVAVGLPPPGHQGNHARGITRLHGFGVKTLGLARYGHLLTDLR